MMFNSGVIASLALAVLFVSVQGRSIQNQGELNGSIVLVTEK